MQFRTSNLIFAAIAVFCLLGITATAQKSDKNKKKDNTTATQSTSAPEPTPTPEDGEAVANEEEFSPYFENYLKQYRLGPSDVISVEVFGQCPDYCIQGRTIPPNARISYPLIPEGILVAGKTVEQIAEEITKHLDEFIIDPKVTVTLDKAMSTRYAVMGSVAQPGVRVMDRKVSVYEAILESGGVTKDGNRNKVFVVSYTKDGRLSRRQINLTAMESGKADMVYLKPGDQVFVEGKGFTIGKFLSALGQASAARALLGSPL